MDSCSIRQAARHIASIMAQRKVGKKTNKIVTRFHPEGRREFFGPVGTAFQSGVQRLGKGSRSRVLVQRLLAWRSSVVPKTVWRGWSRLG